ncbi:hypothetical protein ACQEU3_24375 [Spirillospora sp. CA-253888]
MNRRRIILLAGAVAAAGAAVVGFAGAGQAGRGEPADPVVHEVPAEEAQGAEEYWTEERMRDARPMPMPEGPENP